MALICPKPESNRLYTHKIDQSWSLNKKHKRIYSISVNNTSSSSRFEFSLNPLLTERFCQDLSLDDVCKKIMYPANPRDLWLYALSNNLEVMPAALKQCAAGTHLVEASGRSVAQNKIIKVLKKTPRSIVDKCIVMNDNDDRVPSLPVFFPKDLELMTIFRHCLASLDKNNTNEQDETMKTWNQRVQMRTLSKTWLWKDQVEVVPYALLRRVVESNVPLVPLDPTKTKNQKGSKRKVVMMMQMVAVQPKEIYNRTWGTPQCPAEEPFTFLINGQEYCDTFESFYIGGLNLEVWMEQDDQQNDVIYQELLKTPDKHSCYVNVDDVVNVTATKSKSNSETKKRKRQQKVSFCL